MTWLGLIVILIIVVALIRFAINKSNSKGMRQCPHCQSYMSGNAAVCELCHRDVSK